MTEQKDFVKLFREYTEKYIYYIIGLSTAAIGFSVHKTIDKPLSFSQIPLGISVLSWVVSIFSGLSCIKLITKSLYNQNIKFDIINGRNEISGNHPEKIEIGLEAMNNIDKEISKRGAKKLKNCEIYFYAGIVLFIVWHVVEMYLKTKK